MDLPKARNISLTDPVTVTLPAHIWLGFFAAYMSTKWACNYASAIAVAAQEQLMDPLWLKEREAHQQQHDDIGQALVHGFLTGRPPEPPPNVTDSPQ